jgi:hypothetical protein
MITIAGVSIVAEKLRGLIESDARQQEEKDKFYGDQQKTSQSETESENKKESILAVSSDLNREAVKLKEACRTKNEVEVNSQLQKITLKIRELRIN